MNIYLQNPRKQGRYFCPTLWKAGGDKDGGWKGGGGMCGVLGLALMLCGGRSRRIGEGIFYCGYLTGGFYGAGVER